MGIFAFRKPKWRHKDPAVRLAAIATIDPGETGLLAELSRDPDREVRHAAINRLADLEVLSSLEKNPVPDDLPVIIARKDVLLYRLATAGQDPAGWRGHLDRISAPELLAELAVHGGQPAIRLAAVHKIDDQHLLAAVVKQNCGKEAAAAAVTKITDEALLAELSEKAASKTARRLAAEKIAAIERQKNPPSDQEIIARQLDALAAEAAKMAESPDIDAAVRRLAAIKEEWEALDRDNTHPAAGTFRKTCEDLDDRYQETLERRKMGQEKAARFDRFQARLAELCTLVERLSCSTAADAQAAKDQAVADWTALAKEQAEEMVPSPTLAKRFAAACRAFDANREKIDRERGLVAAIERQCAEVRELIADRNLKKAAGRLQDAEKALDPLKLDFFSKSAMAKLVAGLSAELNQAETEIRTGNLSRRQEICAELEKLAESDNPAEIARQLHARQQDWQGLTKLEDAQDNELAERFTNSVAALTERLKALKHEQDWQLWANLTLKDKLAERVAALDQEDDPETVVKVIREAQAEWKLIGPVPPRESQKLWDEFHDACTRNFERVRPFLEERKAERAAAVERRREICALTAQLAESTDWQKTTLAIKGLQEEWKNLPHGSRREERALYQQFRSACDCFFARRQEHYEGQDRERRQNLAAKVKLCEEAEQLAAAPWPDLAGTFKRLNAEWKKSGPAPRQEEEAVWQRFRTACDTYFLLLTAEQQRNLHQKEELCAAAEQILAEADGTDNRKALAARLTELQRQWKEIGPVPPELSEAVWQRFRGACDRFFAARHAEYEKEEEQRRANQVRREEILARAEELAGRGTDRETAARLQELQKEWSATGPAPRAIHKELNDRFKALCDAFFADRRQYFIDLKTEQLENQKKKESLCLRLENLLGLSYEPAARVKGKALSLAEELKQAMEDNFMLAGRRHEQKELSDEVKRIRQEWEKIGTVPPAQIRPLSERYKKALDAYYGSKRSPK